MRLMTMESTTANAEQIEYWNEQAGPKWVALQHLIDAQIEPLGRMAMERGQISAGEEVIDVGCGCGATSVAIARRVGPDGRVTGFDVSRPMLERARRAAAEAGLTNVHFEEADVQTGGLGAASFDVVFSRFGVMFFADPVGAFANLRSALRVGGRLAFVCWQAIQDNPWMIVPMSAALQHLPPPPSAAPDAPGPFAFADPNRVQRILSDAGFEDAGLEPIRETLTIGGAGSRLDDAVDFLLQMGPTARLLRESDPALTPRVAASVREALEPYHGDEGLRMSSAAWIVTARKR
jgi:ubiquinone/menaquinone biosynthesis C-methylase UbiE